jgi:hypothetical protein
VTTRAPNRLRDFVILHREVEGLVQHVGLRTWDLLLIDVDGTWIREEVGSEDEAGALCADLGVRLTRGWEDRRLARRFGRPDPWTDPKGQRRAL